jgi:polar amino acid transport system permease protein
MHGLVAVDLHVIWQQVFHPDHILFRTLWATVYISIASQVLGVLLGLLAALARMSRFAALRWLSGIYVWIFRGTPLLVQIFYVYFAFSWPTFDFGFWTVSDAAIAGIVALSVNEGAYMREIIRAGIDSIDRGQMDAARSVGMRTSLAMRRIILPQAARVIVPPLGNEFNNMMKTTSLLAFIGVYELFQDADIHYSTTFKPAEYFIAVAFWYLVLTTVWSLIQTQIERRLSAGLRERLTFREHIARVWAPVGAFRMGGVR